jgi:hypothetical protein
VVTAQATFAPCHLFTLVPPRGSISSHGAEASRPSGLEGVVVHRAAVPWSTSPPPASRRCACSAWCSFKWVNEPLLFARSGCCSLGRRRASCMTGAHRQGISLLGGVPPARRQCECRW